MTGEPYRAPDPEPMGGLFGQQPTEPEEPQLSLVARLRPYQDDAVKAVLRQFQQKVHSTLVVSATGTGKTLIMADLARRAIGWGHGVLWLCHREELMKQGRKALGRMGIPAEFEKAEASAAGAFHAGAVRAVVASTPTLRGDRLRSWPQDAFRLIISDEAHHSISPGWAEIPKHFATARHVGFTATADRLDGANIGRIFETLAYEYNLRDAITDGWLVPIEAFPVVTEPQINLKGLRVTAGDFNTGDLEAVIQANIGTLVNAVRQTNALGDRKTLAFTPDVASAQALALALSDVGISARHIHGGNTQRDREGLLAAFKAGEFQVLTNCMLLTEGVDIPEVSCILMCRPTKSRSLYSQCVGRGTRCWPNPETNTKPNCRIVDFAYLTGTHELVSPVDLYDNANTPDAVVRRAKELIKAQPEVNLDEALEQAQSEYETAERVRIKRVAVQARAVSFDPLGAADVLGLRQEKSGYADWFTSTAPASEKQIAFLRKMRVNAPDDMPKGAASRLISTLMVRRDHKLATVRQVGTLIKLGMDPGEARRTSFTDASKWIDAHKNW